MSDQYNGSRGGEQEINGGFVKRGTCPKVTGEQSIRRFYSHRQGACSEGSLGSPREAHG